MRYAGKPVIGMPDSTISPALAISRPEITRIRVVLPAPFGPITATASPASTASETPNSAWNEP